MLERSDEAEYKGEIQIADPQSSGTAYTALATFAQLWGEDQALIT
jgi:iron(III) transport system substrate-binding protein